MSISDHLSDPKLRTYVQKGPKSQPAQLVLADLASSLEGALPPLDYKVLMSGKAASLPFVPWVAVVDLDVTKTAKSGIYVVYLFDADLKRVYLSLNQGATAHESYWGSQPERVGSIWSNAHQSLRNEAASIRALLPSSMRNGTLASIDLGSGASLPRAYEAANIVAIKYDLDALPSETVLRSDLGAFLDVYAAAIAIRSTLTAQNPKEFVTPSATKVAVGELSTGVFKPKSAEDYLAHIAEHTQQRTRHHERVLESFGLFVKAQGWTPVTDVHPRDLTLEKGETHVLCEVKVVRANAIFAVREAIGQLLTYRQLLYPSEPPTAMLAVFSAPVGDAFVELLDSLGIASVWSDGDSGWQQSSLAAALGIIKPINA